LETVSNARDEALVSPETFQKMADVIEAERARVREKLLSDGPHVPVAARPGVYSEARQRLRDKLLRDDPSPPKSARA